MRFLGCTLQIKLAKTLPNISKLLFQNQNYFFIPYVLTKSFESCAEITMILPEFINVNLSFTIFMTSYSLFKEPAQSVLKDWALYVTFFLFSWWTQVLRKICFLWCFEIHGYAILSIRLLVTCVSTELPLLFERKSPSVEDVNFSSISFW
jgi:hypothetical protein